MEINFKIAHKDRSFVSEPVDINSISKIAERLSEDKLILRGTGIISKISKQEIFEGDILQGYTYPFVSEGQTNYVAVVEWIYNSWQIYVIKVSDRVRGGAEMNHLIEDEEINFKIIGNKYNKSTYPEGFEY